MNTDEIKKLQDKSENNLYDSAKVIRSSKITFIYYLMGITLTIISYLITTLNEEMIKNLLFLLSISSYSCCFIVGFLFVKKDLEIKYLEYERGHFLKSQDENNFSKSVEKFYAANVVYEKLFDWCIYILFTSFILSILWKLESLNILNL